MFMVMNLIGLNRNFIGNNNIEKIIPNIFLKNTTIFTLIFIKYFLFPLLIFQTYYWRRPGKKFKT